MHQIRMYHRKILTNKEWWQRYHCRNKFHAAVRTGKIIRPKTCERCGVECKPEGAHYNYDEPFRVRWLCSDCHRIWDIEVPK